MDSHGWYDIYLWHFSCFCKPHGEYQVTLHIHCTFALALPYILRAMVEVRDKQDAQVYNQNKVVFAWNCCWLFSSLLFPTSPEAPIYIFFGLRASCHMHKISCRYSPSLRPPFGNIEACARPKGGHRARSSRVCHYIYNIGNFYGTEIFVIL